MSSSAFSMAAMACWTTPPEDCRRSAYMVVTCASHARGSLPMTAGASRSITAERPGPPNASLYSLQPTSPVSVVTLRKSKLRDPASAWSDSTLAIFIRDGLRTQRVTGMRSVGKPSGPHPKRIRRSTLTRRSNRMTIRTIMIEHGFLAAMLALVGLEVVVLGYFAYRISRVLERVEGVGAATYLEVRKVLGQSR